VGIRAADLVRAAAAEVEIVSLDEAKRRHDAGQAVFLDVREPGEVARGRIAGAAHVPRGLLEFAADPDNPMHQPALAGDRPIIIYCGSGGRSALAAKTLKDMGIDRVSSMKDGFAAWKEAGFDVDD
jgi:rhodanese-related sulfurtransferase